MQKTHQIFANCVQLYQNCKVNPCQTLVLVHKINWTHCAFINSSSCSWPGRANIENKLVHRKNWKRMRFGELSTAQPFRSAVFPWVGKKVYFFHQIKLFMLGSYLCVHLVFMVWVVKVGCHYLPSSQSQLIWGGPQVIRSSSDLSPWWGPMWTRTRTTAIWNQEGTQRLNKQEISRLRHPNWIV